MTSGLRHGSPKLSIRPFRFQCQELVDPNLPIAFPIVPGVVRVLNPVQFAPQFHRLQRIPYASSLRHAHQSPLRRKLGLSTLQEILRHLSCSHVAQSLDACPVHDFPNPAAVDFRRVSNSAGKPRELLEVIPGPTIRRQSSTRFFCAAWRQANSPFRPKRSPRSRMIRVPK